MPVLFFYAFVVILVAAAAVLGFLTAVYARPRLFSDALARITVGLIIAILVPLVGGISYALSGTSWAVGLLGIAGTWFWLWVAVAFGFGALIGILIGNVRLDE